MGSTPSVPLPEPDPSNPYFVMLFAYDALCFGMATEEVKTIIKQAIQTAWSRGIQKEQEESGAYGIQMHGNAFAPENKRDEAYEGKLLSTKILIDLYACGYDFLVSSDLHRICSVSSWFFQKTTNNKRQSPKIFCLSPSWWDGLQLINADHQIKSILQQCIRQYYKPGIEKEKDYSSNFYEVHMVDGPWCNDILYASIWGRKLLLAVFTKFNQIGYRLYATANLKGTSDSLFFMHDPLNINPDDRFCMISMNEGDKLALIDCTQEFIDTVRESIQRFWPKGLQNERMLDADQVGPSVLEMHLGGLPWSAEEEATVHNRLLLLNMFDLLLSKGWCVVRSLDVNRSSEDKSVFVFKSCTPTTLPHFCLSMNKADAIRTIRAPPETTDAIRGAVAKYWHQGINSEASYHGAHQFILEGVPFSPESGLNSAMHPKVLMCQILRVCQEHGWHVIASADVSAQKIRYNAKSPWHSIDVDSWFLVRTGVGHGHGLSSSMGLAGPSAPDFAGDDAAPPSYDQVVK